MSRAGRSPSLLQGVVAALGLSLAGAALIAALTPVLGTGTALRVVVALLGLAYVLYLLGRSTERTGRITAVVLWAAAAAAVWAAGPSFAVYVLLHAGMVWLVRSLYHHASTLSALADLALTGLAVAFAAWAASRSGSAWLALWCFFLVQAFFVFLCGARPESAHTDSHVENGEAFDRAHRAAQAALRRLVASR